MFCKPGSEFDVVMGHLLGQVQGAVVYFVDDVLVETGEGSAPEELLGCKDTFWGSCPATTSS